MNSDGTKRLADNTLVALTLMIAESKIEEKDVMVKGVIKWVQSHACMSYADREQARRSQGGGKLD